MTTPVQEVLEKLLALHDLDSKALRLEREIREGPAKLAGFQSQQAEIEKKKKAVGDRVVVLRAQIKLRENELRSTEQKIERTKKQASEVKTNKEFVAYRAELSNYQADADRLQGEILKILEVVEQAEAKIAAFDDEIAGVGKKVDAAQGDLDASLEGVKAERDELLAQRPELKKGIPGETMQTYERVRQSRGTGLAPIDGEYCSACMERLTRNDVFAVQNRSRLVICRGCNRILVPEA